MPGRKRPKLAVWKFASCDGCQLALLDCEDELPALAASLTVAYFPEMTRTVVRGRYDISLVEGSITTPEALEQIQHIRAVSRRLVAIGACATAGGIQALRNFGELSRLAAAVYPSPGRIAMLDSATPVADHVPVDVEVRGCPVNKQQLLEVISALLHGRRPELPRHSLCLECKAKGIACLIVSKGLPCLGPVTQAGCGALCPYFDRACYGCFGPQDSVNGPAMLSVLDKLGVKGGDLGRLFRKFAAGALEFRAMGDDR
jgi:coenzyme F420-reducing hydrogenase gamma subunit